jgi:Tol biopolymer transport system component
VRHRALPRSTDAVRRGGAIAVAGIDIARRAAPRRPAVQEFQVRHAILIASIAGFVTVARAVDATAQSIELVSVSSGGAVADFGIDDSSITISDDGNRVAFASLSDNLVANDTSGVDVFVRDRRAGTTLRVSVRTNGVQTNNNCENPRISADGNVVAFDSEATNLVAGDRNGASDVFVHDLTTGITSRVSLTSASGESNGDSYLAAISSDGRYVAFESSATNLVSGDTNGAPDIFVRDRVAGTTTRASVDSLGNEAKGPSFTPSLSRDGRFVVFTSRATNLDPNDVDGNADAYLHDMVTGATVLVSVDSNGVKADLESFHPVVSDDGRYVAFASYADNLVPNDVNHGEDVFVHDLVAGTTWCASVDSNGRISSRSDLSTLGIDLSGDGRFVLYDSPAQDLVDGDLNGLNDQFSHENLAAVTTRPSVADDGSEGNGWSGGGRCSDDGSAVAFASYATNLVANPPVDGRSAQAYVRVRAINAALAQNYGTGFPGSNGIPALGASRAPTLARVVDLTLTNSFGQATGGLFVVGFQSLQRSTSFGGDLLVAPSLILPLNLDSGGTTLSGSIPDDELLAGRTLYFQGFEFDPGAAKGISSTDGLELVLGY